jgi:hypothetical protein
MNLQNGYKVIYEKIADGKRTFLASKTGIFADAEAIAEFETGKYKLVYEKNGKIYCSESGVPADTDQPAEAFDKVFTEGELTEDESAEEEKPEQEAHPEAIDTNGDSHGKLTVNGNVVTLKATGTIEPATNPNGNTYHHVGFKITAPDGIDPANVVITRPDGKTRIMANILDGANYTNMYWQPTETDRVFTYYIDWNNDGVNDLTVVIDASKATLGVKPEAEQVTE